MLKKLLLIVCAAIIFLPAQGVFAQIDGKQLGSVTVKDVDPVYKNLRSLSDATDAFGGDYVTVTNAVMKKDRAVFTLQSGEIYFNKSVEGRKTGAVFLGTGEFSLTPPNEVEQKSLAIFTDKPEIKETFRNLVMFFSDETFEQLINSPGVKMGQNGPQAALARETYRDRENKLRKDSSNQGLTYNITSRLLSDYYAPRRAGFFMTFIEGVNYGKLLYEIDPLGIPQIYPEQVMLMSYGETNGGIWTAFHKLDEYKKGTATSWQDRRIYDIKHHDIDATISGTRLSGKDMVTLEMREANARFLPFDLFGSLRVTSVKDESGTELSFIQEKRDEDSDFGVILPKAVEPGKPFKLTLEYGGAEALHTSGNGNFILAPRSTWYPNNPGTSFGDRASFDLTFHYPKRYVLVGVGNRVGEPVIEKDVATSKWTTDGLDYAVAGFNYGDFKEKEVEDAGTGYKMEVYANRELPTELKRMNEYGGNEGNSTISTITGDNVGSGSLSTLSGASGVLTDAQNATRVYNLFFGKLPYKRIAMTQQPAGFFGQAWATLIYLPYYAYVDPANRVKFVGLRGGTDGFWTEVTPHEVAHQWWGHIVGWTSYRDQWMSEGFAQFSAALYIQYIEKNNAKFLDFWQDQHDLIVQSSPATKGRKPYTVGSVTQGYRLNTAKTGDVAERMIYPKGAFILQMIRMMMYDGKNGGDKNFQEMMQNFISSHYNKDVSTNDFKLAVEKYMTPKMDVFKNGKMDWFFDEYVYGTEMPSYKFDYTLADNGGKTTASLKITQSGVSDRFVMIVPIYADFGKGWQYMGVAYLDGNKTQELKDVALPQKPKKMAIAALQDILAEKIENSKQ